MQRSPSVCIESLGRVKVATAAARSAAGCAWLGTCSCSGQNGGEGSQQRLRSTFSWRCNACRASGLSPHHSGDCAGACTDGYGKGQ